ncbi:MAG: polysaccharide deacetylase family protein [Coriobacteriia bacterium]|nr:polysaccharide deacetylase family protein [Coriobacteriia bacterium]
MRGLEQGSRLTIALRRARVRKGMCAFVTFHRVWENDMSATDMGMPPAEFETFLDAFSERYTLLQVGEAFKAHAQNTLPRNGLALTFDDGYADMSTVIAPILTRRELPATFFVATSFIGADEGLTVNQLTNLANNPLIEIGGHTRTHPHLSQLTSRQQYEEIAGNKSDLEALIGGPLVSFAYPYGGRADVNRSAIRTARKAGYLGACTTESLQIPEINVLCKGVNPYRTNRFATNRINPEELCRAIDYLGGLS